MSAAEGSGHFHCALLRCDLSRKSCVSRQDLRRTDGRIKVPRPVHRPCGLGTCVQGQEVRASLGAGPTPAVHVTKLFEKERSHQRPAAVPAPILKDGRPSLQAQLQRGPRTAEDRALIGLRVRAAHERRLRSAKHVCRCGIIPQNGGPECAHCKRDRLRGSHA